MARNREPQESSIYSGIFFMEWRRRGTPIEPQPSRRTTNDHLMPNTPDILLLQLFFIFVWAKIFGEVFERLALPAVIGEILAGVVLGPYATNFVAPSDTINSIAEVGAIFLLFTVGLEIRPNELLRVGRESLRVALAGVAVPFA